MKFYFVGNYDSRRPGHSYSGWTVGSDWVVKEGSGKIHYLGFRSSDHDYVIKLNGNTIPDETEWIEYNVSNVPGRILARFGVLKPEWLEAIREEKANLEEGENEVLTSTQACLMLDFSLNPLPLKVKIDQEKYGEFAVQRHPSEYPEGSLFTPDLWYRFFTVGAVGSRYLGKVYIPWEKTSCGSREAYWEERRREEEAERLAEAKRKAEREAARKARASREAAKRREFAGMCGRKARMYRIPFEIALAFKGDDQEISEFVRTLKLALSEKPLYDSHELSCGRARNGAELRRIGIAVGSVDTNRIAKYVLCCLEEGEMIK